MNPTLTTIIPAHNAALFLRQAVTSLLHAGGGSGIEDHEIIIVDDGSTDSTRDLAEELALGDDRVWLIDQAHQGVSAARNTAIDVARGEWLHFLDADDWMLDGGLARLIDEASRSTHAGACASTALFAEDGTAEAWRVAPDDELPEGTHQIGITELLTRRRFHTGAMLIRRRAIGELRFDPSLGAAEDWDLWLRLAERGVTWGVVPGEVMAYRLRRGGASHRFADMAASARTVLENAFERCRRHSADVIPPSQLRHEHLESALRRSALQQATAASLDDPTPQRDGAFTVLISNWPAAPLGLTPPHLADAAFRMIPFAAGRAPTAWRSADAETLARYRAAADALWCRLEREGLAPRGSVAAAHAELARLRSFGTTAGRETQGTPRRGIAA
ncbi:MAG: glycosyltransferase family 2 protein [Phycisphaerales bacterium]